jgi:hypothetical protein
MKALAWAFPGTRPRLSLFLVLASQLVFGQDGTLMITINNDTSDNLLVTAYDRSTTQQILAGRPIYGNASISVAIIADGSGRGRLSWTAMSIDRDMRMCGHGESSNLSDGDSVNVHADDDCGG